MAKVTYIGTKDTTSTQGFNFKKGQAVDIESDAVIKRLENNRYFEVSSEKKEKEPTVADYKAALEKAGVEFDKAAKKEDLKKLIDEKNLAVVPA
jgi:hypothetical protein